MRSFLVVGAGMAILALFATPALADIIGVSLGPSSGGGGGAAASIIAAPAEALDDNVTNAAQQGFNEAHGVIASQNWSADWGGVSQGDQVNSHMIFLNRAYLDADGNVINYGSNLLHVGVTWTFNAQIVAVMSNYNGSHEIDSTTDFGAPGTTYPAAYFNARGMEPSNGNIGNGLTAEDGYTVSGNTITVAMLVSQPGDWIRVITAVPEPGTMLLMGLGIAGLAASRRRRRSA